MNLYVCCGYLHTGTPPLPSCEMYNSYMPPWFEVFPVRPGRTRPAMSNPLRYVTSARRSLTRPHTPRMRADGIQDESRERQRTRKCKAEPDGAARPPRTAPDHPGQLPPRCSGALLRTPHREGHPPRPGVHPSVQRRIFRGPRRMGKPRRNLRWNFSMGYPTRTPPTEQASWLLGFPTSRDHPLT